MRGLDRVHDLLPAVDVLPRSRELVLVDARVLALTDDLRDAVRRAEDEVAVADLVVVAVEAAHRRAGRAVAFRVGLAAVAPAAEAAGRNGRGLRQALAAPATCDLLHVALHAVVRLYRATPT